MKNYKILYRFKGRAYNELPPNETCITASTKKEAIEKFKESMFIAECSAKIIKII